MNNRGQSLAMAILTSIFIILVGMMSVNFLMPEITNFRVSMNCADASAIGDGVKLLCLATDATIPYWIILTLSLAIGVVASRFVF